MNAEILHLIIDQFVITNFINSSHMFWTVRSLSTDETINQAAFSLHVALRNQHAIRMRHIVIRGLPNSTIWCLLDRASLW